MPPRPTARSTAQGTTGPPQQTEPWRALVDAAARTRTKEAFFRLREYLLAPGGLLPIEKTLDYFDVSSIPTTSTHSRAADAAERGLVDLTAMLNSFVLIPPSTHARIEEEYKKQVISLILERWKEIMRWIVHFLVVRARTSARASQTVMRITTDFLRAILKLCFIKDKQKETATEIDTLKEELVSLPYTADFIFLLLCQIDPETKQYYHVPLPEGTIGCMVISVLKAYNESTSAALLSVMARLKTVSPKTRRRIIDAIVLRAPQTASTATAVAQRLTDLGKPPSEAIVPLFEAMDKIYSLIFDVSQILLDPRLAQPFFKQNALLEFAKALNTVSRKAHSITRSSFDEDSPPNPNSVEQQFWKRISGTLVWFVGTLILKRLRNPPEAMPAAIEGGILQTALRILPHLDASDNATDLIINVVLIPIFSFIPLQKAWKGLKSHADEWEDALHEARRTSRGARMVCRAIQGEMERSTEVYEGRKRTAVEMCSNLNHPRPKKLGMFDKPPSVTMRACGGCHAVQYCSKKCQEEDWKALHSQECPRLTKWYGDATAVGCWTTTKLRRDYLTYLEALANEHLPPLPALNPGRTTPGVRQLASHAFAPPPTHAHPPPSHYHPDTTISLFSYVSHEGLATKLRYPATEFSEVAWEPVNRSFAEGALDARVRTAMGEVDKDWERMGDRAEWCAVEGVFPFTSSVFLWVFARVRWDESEPVGRRYKIGSGAAFRLGDKDVSTQVWGPYERDEDD